MELYSILTFIKFSNLKLETLLFQANLWTSFQIFPAFCDGDFCENHLGSRNLPASDADGLADPCYEVRFEEMTLKLEERLSFWIS